MSAISTNNSATTLAQALAKLAADEAAKASAKVITTDESEVSELEKTQSSSTQTAATQSASSQGAAVDVIA